MKSSLKTVLFLAGVLFVVSGPRASAHIDVTVQQAKDLIDSTPDLTVVDVREPSEYCSTRGHIPGALNYPWTSGVLRDRYEELPADGPILVVCQSGGRSNAAATFLDSNGFSKIYDMLRGMSAWLWETAPCKYSGGSGTPDDPYQIATAEDLITLGETPEDYDEHFVLTADIDLDPNLPGQKVFDWAVIAPDVDADNYYFQGIPYSGVFDGNSHTISHLTITGVSYLGLFGELASGAEVKDLGVVDVNISGSGDGVGGLVGHSQRGAIVIRCYSTGTVNGDDDIGGLVGINGGHLTQCYSTSSVNGNYIVGGLLGANEGEAAVLDCYNTGVVNGDDVVAGLVGFNLGDVTRCRSAGTVTGDQRVGGLLGWTYGSIISSFWDAQTSGQTNMCGSQEESASGCADSFGLTTAEMQTAATFLEAGWDFADETENGPNDIWKISEGLDYPRLWWEKYGGGTGELNNPYLVYTVEHLNELGAEPNDWDKHFRLMADIDLAGHVYDAALIAQDGDPIDPAFQGTSFAGVFDGNRHAISNLTIDGAGYLGLFGRLNLVAEVANLELLDVNISGADYVAGLVGFNSGSIKACGVTGEITGYERVGGLTARNWGDIAASSTAGMVAGFHDVGGLTGANYRTIKTSYSTAAVSGYKDVGGLVAENYGSIDAGYSTGTVEADINPGGLAAYNWPDAGTISGFWDVEASGLTTSDGGTGKKTAEMQAASTFIGAGWDFAGETANGTDDIWWIIEGQDYPRLWWETDGN